MLLLLTGICICVNEMRHIEKTAEVSTIALLRREAQEQITPSLFPIFSFVSSDGHESSLSQLLQQKLIESVPVYAYGLREDFTVRRESYLDYDKIIRAEGSDEFSSDLENSIKIDDGMEAALEQENKQIIEEQVREENSKAAGIFIPHTKKQQEFDRTAMQDEEWVRSNFYAIDATTQAQEGQLTAAEFLAADLRVPKGGDSPKILIYHTHSQESYADSVPGDPSQTVVGVGEKLAVLLREEYGYQVLHHTGEYDVERRDYAYSKAAPALEALLEEHPDIDVILDVHRDSVAQDRKLVVDIDGRPTAMVMFFNGLSYTRQTGPIAYLENPNLKGNLAFAFQMQVACNEYYPGLTRRIYLKGYRYNMHYRPKTLLIELGAQTNTVEEAMNACEPLAQMLSLVFEGRVND